MSAQWRTTSLIAREGVVRSRFLSRNITAFFILLQVPRVWKTTAIENAEFHCVLRLLADFFSILHNRCVLLLSRNKGLLSTVADADCSNCVLDTTRVRGPMRSRNSGGFFSAHRSFSRQSSLARSKKSFYLQSHAEHSLHFSTLAVSE